MNTNLYPYQVAGIKFLKARKRALLGDEPGLGKTVQLLEASQGNTLIVAPASILHAGVWTDEINKWTVEPERFHQVSYTYLAKRNGGKMLDIPRDEYNKHWDTVILDEVHNVKNVKAHSTKATETLCRNADRVYLATGTPILNYPQELYQICRFLFPDLARPGKEFGSKWRWVDEWFDTKPNRFNQQARDIIGLRGCTPECKQRAYDDPCEHTIRFVKSVFKGNYLGRLRDEVLKQLPSIQFTKLWIPMVDKQDRAYETMLKEYLVELEQGGNRIALNFSSRHHALSKITTGVGVLDDPPTPAMSAKFDLLQQLIVDNPHPILVVCHYRDSATATRKLINKTGRNTYMITGMVEPSARKTEIDRFRADPTGVLIGTIHTISEGVTLTNTHTIIFLEQSYKPSKNEQAIRRIHRIGQTHTCQVYTMVATRKNKRGTVDVIKDQILKNKTDAQLRTITCAQMLSLLQDV